MQDMARDIEGVRVLVCAERGPSLANERDASAFISAAWQHEATLVAVPTQRLSGEFFRLRTRVAGEILQKFQNYRVGFAVVGDISEWTSQSQALRDLVYESNRGSTAWFMRDMDELARQLRAAPPR